MAYVRFLQEKYSDAEKEVFDLVKKYPAYDHWKAKAFILLGDVYVQLDDRFQAKATLQAVIDNSTEPELVARKDGGKKSWVQRMAEKQAEIQKQKGKGGDMRNVTPDKPKKKGQPRTGGK